MGNGKHSEKDCQLISRYRERDNHSPIRFNLNRAFGSRPLKLFLSRDSSKSRDNCTNSEGSDPDRLFPPKRNVPNSVMRPISEGRLPFKSFCSKSKFSVQQTQIEILASGGGYIYASTTESVNLPNSVSWESTGLSVPVNRFPYPLRFSVLDEESAV
jgi:hypothetical protein